MKTVTPIKILLVEDDEDDRRFFFEFVGQHPRVELLPSLSNGVEVLSYITERCPKGDDCPDLIVLDQNMPKMNGKETLAALKGDPRWAPISVVVYSTYSNPVLVAECMALGAAGVHPKPDSEAGYEQLIEICLGVAQ